MNGIRGTDEELRSKLSDTLNAIETGFLVDHESVVNVLMLFFTTERDKAVCEALKTLHHNIDVENDLIAKIQPGRYDGSSSIDARILQSTICDLRDFYEAIPDEVSLCSSCNCMTHTVSEKCGKCKAQKEGE